MNASRIAASSAATLALTLPALGGGTPFVDGKRDASYGPPIAVQKSTVISYENAPRVMAMFQSNQSNVGGKAGYNVLGTQSGPQESDPAGVTTGVEVEIAMSALPGQGVAGQIRICAFINGGGHGFVSNQVSGGLQGDPDNLGEPRNVNFASLAGDQFITINTAVRSGTAPVIDGIRDAAYGARFAQVDVGTGFASNSRSSMGAGIRNRANGSEIDGVYAYIYNNGTPGNVNDDFLLLLVTGNLETNFNKLEIFIDCAAGGQNTLRTDNVNVDFDGLNRMGGPFQPAGEPPPPEQPGLTFDAAVSPDFWMSVTIGGGTEPAAPTMFINFATLPSLGGGVGDFFGGPNATVGPSPVDGDATPPEGGATPIAIRVDSDNSNTSAVMGSGGVGGRVNLPGSGSQMDVSDPLTVSTGVEFKINLEGIGYPIGNAGSVKIAGILVGPNYDFMSNQAIGGLTSAGNPDPNNLGAPAKNVDFNDWDGDQFVTVAVAANPGAQPAGAAIDGRINSSAGETSAYGAALWVNKVMSSNRNATGFGDSVASMTFVPGPNRSNGSEMNAVYFYVARDPSNGNAPTLYGLVTGNLHDFNKLVLFFDTNAGGQNDLRGDNAGFEGFNSGLGGPDGFTFDAGFAADYAVAYTLGFDSNLDVARHFADGTQLLADGGGYGGRFGGGNKTDTTTTTISGTIIAREGAGNNNLAPLMAPSTHSVDSNGSELNALYLVVEPDGFGSGIAYLMIAGNFEPNFTSVEIFFDTVMSAGQNTLIYSDKSAQDPLYTGNPDVDFGALNNMGGPVLNEMMEVQNPGMTFDAGFEPDYYLSVRVGDYNEDLGFPQAFIYGNWARLRTLSDPIGPMPADAGRYLGAAIADDFGGSAAFVGGDLGSEPINAAALDNANTGGTGGGRQFFCPGTGATNPATVTTGLELAIDLLDLGFGTGPAGSYTPGVSKINMVIFLNGPGHDYVFNQTLQHSCTNDLGEPRDVNFNSIQGSQAIGFPTPITMPNVCVLDGDANGDFVVNFDDILAVLANFLSAGPIGDADRNGVVNFNDILKILSVFNSGGC